MTSFRSPKSQAMHYAREIRNMGRSQSLGTLRIDEAALTRFASYLKENKLESLKEFTPAKITPEKNKIILDYLSTRKQKGLTQSTIDQDRQSLQRLSGGKFLRAKANLAKGKKASHYRHYTPEQISLIIDKQKPHNSLATKIAAYTGIRAHELITLRSISERSKSKRDTEGQVWEDRRFKGLSGRLYSVIGKGGLCREVILSHELVNLLENVKLDQPRMVTDRGIHYQQFYDISGGQKWSQSFTQASQKELGWSDGAHALRHTYAERRLDQLLKSGLTRERSLCIIAQEMGHFRSEITEVYLR
ncbi:site-specific integrase [Piscirickettsia litoralis]|uniref:Tyr recombinase domain-containing protein n=1 Tax=Piscirickettsia litoralis TaxID=1891921 RepID=A0ABX2ZY98_9GAMM|nr:site-specific integrase [Piscirickettsia litoralis]ODN40987.1 hypothetical protein BGC07_18705 [Piscirickettsia litoralis]